MAKVRISAYTHKTKSFKTTECENDRIQFTGGRKIPNSRKYLACSPHINTTMGQPLWNHWAYVSTAAWGTVTCPDCIKLKKRW